MTNPNITQVSIYLREFQASAVKTAPNSHVYSSSGNSYAGKFTSQSVIEAERSQVYGCDGQWYSVEVTRTEYIGEEIHRSSYHKRVFVPDNWNIFIAAATTQNQ